MRQVIINGGEIVVANSKDQQDGSTSLPSGLDHPNASDAAAASPDKWSFKSPSSSLSLALVFVGSHPLALLLFNIDFPEFSSSARLLL